MVPDKLHEIISSYTMNRKAGAGKESKTHRRLVGWNSTMNTESNLLVSRTSFQVPRSPAPNTHTNTNLGHNRWHKEGLIYSKDLILQHLTSHPGTSQVPSQSAKQKSNHLLRLSSVGTPTPHTVQVCILIRELDGNRTNEWLSHLSPAAGHRDHLNSGVSALQI